MKTTLIDKNLTNVSKTIVVNALNDHRLASKTSKKKISFTRKQNIIGTYSTFTLLSFMEFSFQWVHILSK